MIVPDAKRLVDATVGVFGSLLTAPLVVVLIVVASVDTRSFGLFRQPRVGRRGELFHVMKIRTMRAEAGPHTTITVERDPRITRLGAILRRWKLDELPQLWNVARGHMSLVGPRPDVPGYADTLSGDDRAILEYRPGVTGPATLVFRREEQLLARTADPVKFNDEAIWPAKVALNRAYVEHATFGDDVRMIALTLRPDHDALAAMIDRWDAALRANPVITRALEIDAADAAGPTGAHDERHSDPERDGAR